LALQAQFNSIISSVGMTYYLCLKWLHRFPSELDLSDVDLEMLKMVEAYENSKSNICATCREDMYNAERICWICGRPYVGDEKSVDAEEFFESIDIMQRGDLRRKDVQRLHDLTGIAIPQDNISRQE